MKTRFKKILALGLTLAIGFSLLTGCDKGLKTGTSDKKVVTKLKFAHHNPLNAFVSKQGFEPWAKLIEEKTGGKVKIDIYPASTLGKAPDTFDNTIKGVNDIGWVYTAFNPGRFPLTEVLNLPMMGLDSASMGSKVVWELYRTNDAIKKEFADVKVLALHAHGPSVFITKKAINSYTDLQGKKLRTAGGPIIQMAQALGASPMAMPSSDTYQAAEKGVIDGAILPWEPIEMMNLQEVLKYVYEAKITNGVFILVMNKKVWESLSPDVQKVLDEESGDKVAQMFAKTFDDTEQTSIAKFEKAGGKRTAMPKEEEEKMRVKAKGVWEKWVADLEAKGMPAKTVLEDAQKIITKYRN